MTQEESLKILKTGVSVFLTGEPGSGKTHTVNRYVDYLRSRGVEPAITASTGIAATHIGGFTIHSWSGIGVRRSLDKNDLDRIGQNRNVVRRVGRARILIIDEISMLSARTFGMIDTVCRRIRRDQRPFGGLQMVLVGDFFQLPPVSRRDDENEQETLSPGAEEQFAFFSPNWDALNPIVCYLSEQHRQEGKIFLELLSAIRETALTEKHIELLRRRYNPKPKGAVAQLYSHNADVDEINNVELAKLPGKLKWFEMTDRGPEKFVTALKRGCLSPEILKLKIGARVIFTKNDAVFHKYVNGTMGEVLGFSKEDGCPIVKTNDGRTIFAQPAEWRLEDGGRVIARVVQIPLRLAWAMTIHKSQGMSLDAAHIDLSDAFEYGQGYVALSRLRALNGLSLAGLNERALLINPKICAEDGKFRAKSDDARQRFDSIDSDELKKKHDSFIYACGGNPKVERGVPSRVLPKRSTYDATKELILQKLPLENIAKKRGATLGTIIGHLEKLAAGGKIEPRSDLAHFKLDPGRFNEIEKVFKQIYEKDKKVFLAPVRAALGEDYSYDEIRLARLFIEL